MEHAAAIPFHNDKEEEEVVIFEVEVFEKYFIL